MAIPQIQSPSQSSSSILTARCERVLRELLEPEIAPRERHGCHFQIRLLAVVSGRTDQARLDARALAWLAGTCGSGRGPSDNRRSTATVNRHFEEVSGPRVNYRSWLVGGYAALVFASNRFRTCTKS